MTIGHPTDTDAIMVGTQRPTLEVAKQQCADAGRTCPMGHTMKYVGTSIIAAWENTPSECWAKGCYDKPVHASLKEIIAAGWEPKVPA